MARDDNCGPTCEYLARPDKEQGRVWVLKKKPQSGSGFFVKLDPNLDPTWLQVKKITKKTLLYIYIYIYTLINPKTNPLSFHNTLTSRHSPLLLSISLLALSPPYLKHSLKRSNILDLVELYNLETKFWETLPLMKKSRKMCSGVFMDEKFYVIGGIGGPI